MARKRKSRPSVARPSASRGNTSRDKIIAAFLALLAEKPFERIGLAELAKSAGVSLADLRGEFGSTLAILARARTVVRCADAPAGTARTAQGSRAFTHALGGAQSRACAGAQCDGGALAAMDVDRREYHRRGTPRADPRARTCADVRQRAAHLGGRRREGTFAHARGARRRVGERPALVGTAGRYLPASRTHLQNRRAAALAPIAPQSRRADGGVESTPALSPSRAGRRAGCRRVEYRRRASARCHARSRGQARCPLRPDCGHRRAAGMA